MTTEKKICSPYHFSKPNSWETKLLFLPCLNCIQCIVFVTKSAVLKIIMVRQKLKVGWSFGKVGVGMKHIFDGWGPHNITEVNLIY
jgi:hypothetical protein